MLEKIFAVLAILSLNSAVFNVLGICKRCVNKQGIHFRWSVIIPIATSNIAVYSAANE